MELRIGDLSLTGPGRYEGALDMRIVPSGDVQVTKAIGAAGITLQDRGNYQHTITFTVWRVHLSTGQADPELAAYFLDNHNKAVQAVGKTTFTKITTAGAIVYTPAIAQVTNSYTVGCSTCHSYRIIAGRISSGTGGGGVTTH